MLLQQEGLGQTMRSGGTLTGQKLLDSKWFATYDPPQGKPNKSFSRYTSWTPDMLIEHLRNKLYEILGDSYTQVEDKEEEYWQFTFKVKEKTEIKMKIKIS